MFDPRATFLDLETTGASADRDRITEIGLLEVVDGKLVGEWSTLVDPGHAIPAVITSLTGITNEMVAGAPTFGEIGLGLLERLEGRLLVAHNARFDYAFLRAEFRRIGIRFRSRVLCTVRLSRALFPEHRHHNLDSIMERFGLSCAARHRALGDAQVVWAFARELERAEPERLAKTVAAITRVPTLPAGLTGALQYQTPPGCVLRRTDTPVCRQSANLRSRVLAHFGGDGHLDRAAAGTADRFAEWIETAVSSARRWCCCGNSRDLQPAARSVAGVVAALELGAWSSRWRSKSRHCVRFDLRGVPEPGRCLAALRGGSRTAALPHPPRQVGRDPVRRMRKAYAAGRIVSRCLRSWSPRRRTGAAAAGRGLRRQGALRETDTYRG
jgi:DNA polymerase III epsilon subunit family exonuclease